MTTTPKRIQRSRARGWRMPEGAVYVGRPTRFGNPFRSMGDNEIVMCDASHRRTIFTPWVCFLLGGEEVFIRDNAERVREVVALYRRWLGHEFDAEGIVRPCLVTPADLARIRGKDLACWCPLDKPCHADVLLEIANG